MVHNTKSACPRIVRCAARLIRPMPHPRLTLRITQGRIRNGFGIGEVLGDHVHVGWADTHHRILVPVHGSIPISIARAAATA